MEIRRYTQADEAALMALIEGEGEDWACYWAPDAAENYKRLLMRSITYVAYEEGVLCGYSRAYMDGDLYIFVLDLLVTKAYRGRETGRQLMEQLYRDYTRHTVYVLSGVDGYYSKLGYQKEGSIYAVNRPGQPDDL